MKTPFLALAVLAAATLAVAQDAFPGLKAVLTEAEWKRAGLDRLTVDQIGVIDAALIRYQASATAGLRQELVAAKQAPVASTQTATTPEKKRGLLERFGFPVFDDNDWKSLSPLTAKVVTWESANRFKLDNGQVWEGAEAIPYELVGKAIEIRARPNGQFALVVEGQNTTVRVYRLR